MQSLRLFLLVVPFVAATSFIMAQEESKAPQPPRPMLIFDNPLDDPNLPFRQACSHDSVEKITQLLADGADPNTTNAQGRSVLCEAVGNLDARVVPKLLAAGAKPDASAMWQAGWLNKGAALDAMLAAGGKPDDALHGAALGKNVTLVKLLLAKSANPRNKTRGSFALHAAALQGGPETVKLLLAAGAEVNAVDDEGETPLHCNVKGDAELVTVQMLVEAGAKLNVPDKEGLTPVRFAGMHRPGPVYDYLLKASGGKEPRPAADPNSPAAKKTTAALLSEIRVAATAAAQAGERPDREAQLQTQRELLTRGDLMEEILKRVGRGEKLSAHYHLLRLLGPAAEPALPLLVELLDDKQEVQSALFVMSSIKPGSFDELPLERRQRTAANMYEAVHDPQLQQEEAGFRIIALVGLADVAVPHLLKLLRSENPRFRTWTCECLRSAQFASDEITAELIKLATLPGELSTRKQAISALGHFGGGKDPQVKAALLALLQNPPPQVQEEIRVGQRSEPSAFNAWRECAETAGPQLAMYGPAVIDDLLPMIMTDNHAATIGVTRTLERLDARAMPRLIELLGHKDERVTNKVMYAVSQKHDAASMEVLCAALDGKDQRLVENVALALSQNPRRDVLPKLLEVAADQKRPATLRATAASGPARVAMNEPERAPQLLAAIPALIEVLETGTPDQQSRAAQSLGHIGAAAQDALPALRKKLTEPDEVVKVDQVRRTLPVKTAVQAAIQSIERQVGRPQP